MACPWFCPFPQGQEGAGSWWLQLPLCKVGPASGSCGYSGFAPMGRTGQSVHAQQPRKMQCKMHTGGPLATLWWISEHSSLIDCTADVLQQQYTNCTGWVMILQGHTKLLLWDLDF